MDENSSLGILFVPILLVSDGYQRLIAPRPEENFFHAIHFSSLFYDEDYSIIFCGRDGEAKADSGGRWMKKNWDIARKCEKFSIEALSLSLSVKNVENFSTFH